MDLQLNTSAEEVSIYGHGFFCFAGAGSTLTAGQEMGHIGRGLFQPAEDACLTLPANFRSIFCQTAKSTSPTAIPIETSKNL
jgi:hypothetical protein